MTWLSGPCVGPPAAEGGAGDRFAELILDVVHYSFEGGRAAERGDIPEALLLNRRVMVTVGMLRAAMETESALRG